MRRFALILAIILAICASFIPAQAHVHKPIDSSVCQQDWHTTKGARKMIRCLSNYFGGDTPVVIWIARCESRFRHWVKNAASSAGGLFQHLESTWVAHRAHHLPGSKNSRFHGRSSAIVAIREMVHLWRDGRQWPYASWEASRACWKHATL